MRWLRSSAILLVLLSVTLAKDLRPNPKPVHPDKKPSSYHHQHNARAKPVTSNLVRKLDFGQDAHHGPVIPSPVQVSSQSIQINRPHGSEGGKRRKNPHRKRQILIQDATQYLASQGISVPQQQGQQMSFTPMTNNGGSSAADALAMAAAQNAAYQNMFYSQPMQQDSNGAYSMTPIPSLAQYQYPSVTAAPMQIQTAHGATASPQTQIYVLQPDGNTYAPLNAMPMQFQQRVGEPAAAVGVQPTSVEQIAAAPSKPPVPEPPTAPKVTVVHHASATPQKQEQPQEHKSRPVEIVPKSEPKQQPQQQHQEAASVQQVQVQQQPQQPLAAESQQQGTILLPQGASTLIHTNQPLEQQFQQFQQQQFQQSPFVQIPQVVQQQQPAQQQAQPQPQPQAQSQDQPQPQAQPQQSQQPQTLQSFLQPAPGQAFILQQPHQQPQSPVAFQHRPAYVQPAHPSNFVIRPQTYVNPGGQMFTVPVPIPAERPFEHRNGQERQDKPEPPAGPHRIGEEKQERERQDSGSEEHNDERNDNRRHDDEHHDEPPHKEFRPYHAIMHRVIDAFSVNRRTQERVEKNIYLPVLASTGVFLGLGALAAGWYLSQANREVGLLRRVGKPGSGNAIKRVRRDLPGPAEMEQAQFFQTIIQHAIEKQQKEYEGDQSVGSSELAPQYGPPAHHHEHQATHHHTELPTEIVQHKPVHKVQVVPYDHHHHVKETVIEKVVKPVQVINKIHHHHHKHHKKPQGLFSRQAINFARVAVPATIILGSGLIIAGLILYWYLTGDNREIAFLEPSAYSRRRKRSLTDSPRTATLLNDGGWLQRILSAIHDDPFKNQQYGYGGASAASSNKLDMMLNPGGAFDSSKDSKLEDLSNAVVAVGLAVVALFAIMALVSAFIVTEGGSPIFGGQTGGGGQPHYRKARSLSDSNDLNSGLTSNPSFLDKILSNLEVSQSSILSKLQDVGYSKWQETPCAKRIFCDVMSAQSDDTVKVMEKRMATFIEMLPTSLSSSLSKSLGDVMYSIQRKDCSRYTCGGHWVDSSIINQPSPPEPSHQYQPRRR